MNLFQFFNPFFVKVVCSNSKATLNSLYPSVPRSKFIVYNILCPSVLSTLWCRYVYYLTRMTIFIQTKFKKSDEYCQYRVAANITEYHIISKSIFLLFIITEFMR